ncbi:MAG: response regulator [Candidatus Latescibacteria bacterium]|nr:response regulator [Candidatus Latescibacterota bacterium]
MATILAVDDAPSVRIMLKDYLSAEGFRVEVAADGVAALAAAVQVQPDLILLDIMMPEMGGYDFIRTYRQQADTPIILLTAKVEETDKVVGLELGADDYVTKPFGLRELVARIKAVLRRTDKEAVPAQLLRGGGLELDRERHEVRVEGALANLTPTEFEMLALLMEVPGRVLSRSHLLRQMQGYALEGVERTIDVHIRNLRAKIEPNASKPRYIETVFGVGYRFKGD